MLPGADTEAQVSVGFWHVGIRLPVILMTGHGDIPMSVRAMKAGAVDFLPKPFRDQDMIDAVTVAINRDRMQRENSRWPLPIATQRFPRASERSWRW